MKTDKHTFYETLESFGIAEVSERYTEYAGTETIITTYYSPFRNGYPANRMYGPRIGSITVTDNGTPEYELNGEIKKITAGFESVLGMALYADNFR